MTLTMDRTATRPTTSAVRPFGLGKAVPVAGEPVVMPALYLCPERQISVTEIGTPFIHEPSMKSQFETTSQTREDSQLADDKENDTD
ncbi:MULTISPECIES: putative ATP-grasp-modified RiPP [Streptomyces violaceusniger group]|nr:putative ATP-grasp-modified RiPP [Streptomyces javensis]MBI0317449.1 putative ATP-grasp-modified RiPP [Streptomyces javensis]